MLLQSAIADHEFQLGRVIGKLCIACAALGVGAPAGTAQGQSLDERIDHDRFEQGLAELGLEGLLEHVLEVTDSDDPAAEPLIAIARLRGALANEELNAIERAGIIEKLLTARRELIERYIDDDRAPVWQGDLAFDLLFLASSVDAADVVVEFGIATDEQRQRVQRNGQEALDLVLDASAWLADVIIDLEEDPEFATSAALQQRHRALTTTQMRQRLPFLEAVAMGTVLIASDDRGEETEAEWSRVSSLLSPIVFDLNEPWRSRARAWVGIALLRSGHSEQARSHFTEMLASSDLDEHAFLRITLAGIELAHQMNGPSGALAALQVPALRKRAADDPLLSLLLADQRLIYEVAQAIPELWNEGGVAPWRWKELTGAAAHTVVNLARDAYMGFVSDSSLPLSVSEREALVAGRWKSIIPQSIALEDLPPDMALAAAQSLTADPARRSQAIELLGRLLENPVTSETTSRRIRFSLASLLEQDGQRGAAARTLYELALESPLDPRSPQAAASAAILLSQLRAESVTDSSEIDEAYDAVLDLLLTRFPDSSDIDRWAYERGRFEEARDRPEAALRAYETIAPDFRWHADALFRIAHLHWQLSGEQPSPEAASRITAAVERAQISAQSELDRAAPEAGRRTDLQYYIAAGNLIKARTDFALGRFGNVVDVLADIEDNADLPDSLVSEAVDLRIRALESSDQTQRITHELAALSERDPERATAVLNRITAARLARFDAVDRTQPLNAENREKISGEVLGLAQQAARSAHALDAQSPLRLEATLQLAAVERLLENYEAAKQRYQSLGDHWSNTIDVVLGLAECDFHLEEHGAALESYRTISTALQGEGNATWWLAELRILQIFDRAGRNTDRIYPRIGRLRLLSRDFAANPYYREFAALEAKYQP